MLTWCRLRQLLTTQIKSTVSGRTKTLDANNQYITQTRVIEKSHKKKARQFVDFKQVRIKAGNGGDGCVSFLSLFAREFAGPDGGDGGNGGHIVFTADTNTHSLTHMKSQYKADNGANGRNKKRHGKNSDHLHIKVPIGTMFKDENFILQADLSRDGDHFIGARGGSGGKGNIFYASSINTTPTAYEEGGQGQERKLYIELRVIAHIGLVGFPNAGKSTLLRALSRARPKVASYPFTTLRPHIGMIEYDDHVQVAVADIPGLIPGAHLNRGLGISFLRHIERCVCLLYVIDLSAPDPMAQFNSLQYELEKYEPGLSARPHAVVANKIDLPMSRDNLKKLEENLADYMLLFPISAKENINTEDLVLHIRELYDKHRPANVSDENVMNKL